MIPGLDLWQTILLGILILLCINYLCIILWDKMSMVKPIPLGDEGFENMSEASRSQTLVDEEIYDDFYASVYNKIFQHDKLLQAEAALVLHDWTKTKKPEEMTILDLCCGTGVATSYFAKQNVGKIFAVDRSPSMIRYAKKYVIPKTTLTEKQQAAIEWKEEDAYGPSVIQPASLTHACMFYFAPYHFRDIEAILRNLALWVKPGGELAMEVVNKYKFEPIPDVANPWVAVSPQKYSKERITKAKATFDKFEYESEFELNDPKAEFKETFRFKDGSIRNQKHILWMPSITLIIEKASHAGWRYMRYTNLDIIGFQYGYMLYFSRMP